MTTEKALQLIDRIRDGDCYTKESFEALTMAMDALKTYKPAIDVIPVTHGHWEHYGNNTWLRDDGEPVFIVCSECNNYVLNNGSSSWNFCPNCGADMRNKHEIN